MIRTLTFFLALVWAVNAHAESFMREISELQESASVHSRQVFQDGGLNRMQWEFLEESSNTIDLDISGYDEPTVLILAKNRANSTVRGSYYGIREDELVDRTRFGPGAHALISFKEHYQKFSTINIKPGVRGFYLWLGEAKDIRKLWKDYLEADFNLCDKHFVPMLENSGLSSREQYFELKAVSAGSFPSSPKEWALLYAENCTTGIKSRAVKLAKGADSWKEAEAVRKLYHEDCQLSELKLQLEGLSSENVLLSLEDLEGKFPERELAGKWGKFANAIDGLKTDAIRKIETGHEGAKAHAESLLQKYRDMMLENPLMDDMEVFAISRGIGHMNLRDHALNLNYPGRASRGGNRNKEGAVLGAPTLSTHSILKNIVTANEWNNKLVKLTNLRGDVQSTTLYETPDNQQLISNARLHWDANRIAFTMGSNINPMGLFEFNIETGQTKRLSPDTIDHFVDSCYLPDGNIVVMSTAIMTALPCESGSHLLANMYLLNPETGKMRQLGIDQENVYHATVQDDGRVMFVRYEYADTPHYVTRVLMNMNPDGSNQREVYGSNSVWPTSIFYPQQVPGHPNMFTTVVSGHHGPSHMGRLILFDVNKGRREADGAVQFIGEREEPVEAVYVDRLYMENYPKHMYSVPLDPEYHLSMMKPDVLAPWGLYLVDSFDNSTLIYQPEDEFIAWPQVFKEKPLPPVVPSRIREDSKTSTLYVQDIYEGPGLEGIPRGTVKELAIFAFHYGYKSAASHRYIGIESGWDARYLLGTVPVNEDGSVMVEVPSMMPISLMPLDEHGMAVQKMRSWINPQPGEVLSCVGCHESTDTAPLNKPTLAFRQAPSKIDPFFGKARPYAFVTEVQPLLDKYCISCHEGTQEFDLRNSFSEKEMLTSKQYSESYKKLQLYARRNGPESDYALMVPMEWHASSSKLVQMLKKGHHGVELDDEAWRRLYMWIDLNVPFHAAFHPDEYGPYGDQKKWRLEGLKKYANLDWDPEAEYQQLVKEMIAGAKVSPVEPKKETLIISPQTKSWPIPGKKVKQMQDTSGGKRKLVLEFGETGREIHSYDRGRAIRKTLTDPERLEFVRIPAGKYVMGSLDGYPNEQPRVVEVKKAFWMSTTEITNSQLQVFNPMHDSRFADWPEKDQTRRGVPLYNEYQPAVRVSHKQAMAFCEWLSEQTGHKVKLPTEVQWEWAARAGTATRTWYGDADVAFAKYANLSDKSHGTSPDFTRRTPPQYFLFENALDDGEQVTADVGSYTANPWGLHDMIGNAEEWTASAYEGQDGVYVVKGGSWFDVPEDATSSVRWGYDENIKLPDLGFRVIIEDDLGYADTEDLKQFEIVKKN
ncbi:MAG: SUMF1/EgtB/PvdO family nonheme iron enzyme [Puniceicoccaceae bacterium]